jgi:hypothetical protein
MFFERCGYSAVVAKIPGAQVTWNGLFASCGDFCRVTHSRVACPECWYLAAALLQSQLLGRLEDAVDLDEWRESTPQGLDLEYCLLRNALQARLLGLGKDKVVLVLRDNGTAVASEGTCLALALLCIRHDAIPEADRHELLAAIRWQWLPPSSICYASEMGTISTDMVRLLQKAALFEGTQDLLHSMCPPGGVLHPSALLARRLESQMTELELPWEVSVEDLRGSFGATADIIPAPEAKLFCGFQWTVHLKWGRAVADPTLRQLSLLVSADTECTSRLPPGCILSAVFRVAVMDWSEDRRATCTWQGRDFSAVVDEDVLPARVWPEGDGAPFGLEGGVLKGKVVVQEVL